MSRRRAIRGLILASVAFAFAARAEPPSGSYAIGVYGAPELSLPVALDETDCQTEDGTTLCFDGEILTDGAGNVSGTGLAEFSGAIEGGLLTSITGRVSGSSASPKLRLTISAVGALTSEGATLDIQASTKARCSAAPGGFDCSGRLRLCAFALGRRLGCESEAVEFAVESEGGPWVIALELSTDASGRVSGTGEVLLGTGQVLGYVASGRYDARRDTTSLSLRGVGAAEGSKLRLTSALLDSGSAASGRLDFQVAGQKGRAPLPMRPTFAKPPTFPGHGACIRGAYCDTASDTAQLFSQGGVAPPSVLADTIYFPILGSDSTLR